MANDRMSTSDIGLSRLGQITGERPSDAELQRGIDASMREVIATRGYNPNALRPPEKATPIDAGKVETASEAGVSEAGWYQPKALGPSRRTDEIIEKLADHFQPHEPKSPLRGGEGK